MVHNTKFILKDSDGDGIIQFRWNNKHTGASVDLVDMFDNEVNAVFFKADLLIKLKQIISKLESEVELA
jgi:hypothetical protein